MRIPYSLAFAGLLMMNAAQAQDANALLSRLSLSISEEERLDLLAQAARLEADAGHWEEAVDLATTELADPRVADAPASASICAGVLAENELLNGTPAQALPHGLRAVAYAYEGQHSLMAQAQLLMARIYERLELPVKSLDHALQADPSDELTGDDRVLVRTLIARGRVATYDVDGALATYRELAPMAIAMQEKKLVIECYGVCSKLEAARGRFKEARQYELALLRALTALPSGPERGIALNNLGELSERLGEDSIAMEYFSEASTWLSATPALYERALMNIAIAYGRKGLRMPARYAIDNAIASMERRGANDVLPEAHDLKASLYILNGSYADAEREVRAALAIAGPNGSIEVRLEAWGLMKRIARERGLYLEVQHAENELKNLRIAQADQQREQEHARSEYERMMEKQERDLSARIASEHRDRARVREAHLDAENKAQELGLVRYEKQLQEADLREADLAREKAQQKLHLIEAKLAAERQDHDLRTLRDERTLQMLQLNKLDLERKQKETSMAMLTRHNELLQKDQQLKDASHRRDTLLNRIALTAAALLAGLLIFCLWAILKVKGKNSVIRTHVERIKGINTELSQRNADLTSSIACAQNIQKAIIPTEERLREMLPDSFLYYRPRDIVSGDLPFVLQVDGRLFIATIDCTGHGVPAAMLSFMAYYTLNDIVNTQTDLRVNDILMLLHQRIQQGVHDNAGTQISDGMDITLVELDLERRVMWYSGAQNSLIVRRGGECVRIMGDRCSIGDPTGVQASGFKLHRMDLRVSDHVYLYSDGFVHQFGGNNGRKKFSNARFMKAVQEWTGQSAREMVAQVTSMHQQWQGDQPQTDDIVLIGFSIDKLAAMRAA